MYHCPGFIDGQRIYVELLYFKALHPEYFYDNWEIDTIFDNFPNMIWGGGGCTNNGILPLKMVENILNHYNELGIALQLTCSNPILEPTDVYDRYCNAILERFLKYPQNSILVSSECLENYIREKYPEAKIDCSIIYATKPENINKDFNPIIDKYNRFVIPRVHSKDFEYLQTIGEEKRYKIEILCNDPCPVNCPYLSSHQEEHAASTLYSTTRVVNPCHIIDKKNTLYRDSLKSDLIFYDEFDNYKKLGYNHFKISGRANPIVIIQNIIPFMVKPEYQMEFAFYLLKKIFY